MTTLSHVELGVLGPLQVRQYGLPVAVPGAKPRAVLTMLGLHGGSVVTADALAELLWGARPPRTAVKALQTHISSLRRALGDGYVLTEGTGWTLSTTEIDATRYRLAAKQARDAFAGGDAGQAVARFDEALALWRGVPELPDGPRGGSEKTRWIEGHAALVEDRADALLATGRAAEIVGELEAAIADAPLRERRWSQLMLALYRAGRQGEALAAYQRARSMLADELGVDPGPDLRRLEAAIVAQDAALEIAVPEQLSIVTRAVTFLLTDIEGSTAAWEADANAMATALARHDEIVEQVVTARGGRLVKTRGEGDATFSVFDRPSGAAAAAIELQEAIRHEPWALAEPMRIRVALHTGEVELRDGDYFGRAVNRAARLRSLAEGGQILCSGATAELVIDTLSDDVMLVDLGVRTLRNLARPEHVFELRLETAEDSVEPTVEVAIERPALPAVLAGPGPFVGRVPELEGLLAAWESTLAGGARAVLISGEPGVGKTRLAGEWSRLAYEQGAVVLYGRCDEDLGAAYQPFAEALRTLVPCLGAKRLRGMRGIEALLPLVPGLTDTVPDLPTPARSDPDTERYALFDAVVALLAMASASAPVVLILDDLHWAAKPTLLLLRHVLRFGEHARVQIVGTYRSTDLDRSHPLAAMLADLHRDGSASRLALGGLDEDDVTAYVAEAGYDDVELARALASVTGGNPFFLIEALRHVAESGGRWDPSTLPQGVREAVSRRLSRLPAETNKALAAAAVVGSRFPLALVEQVTGEDLIDAFDEACKAGIVIEEPGGRYRFNHALVRQSLLAELASVRRMRLHQKIATTLEAESGGDDELLAELAYHYFECAWAGNAAKAVEYCRRAADQAIERLAHEGAADFYDRALHALEELDDELPDRDGLQAELLVARCEALLAAGEVGLAADAVAQLRQAAGDSVRLSAWGTSFDGQLSMLTDPERLDEIESEVSAAAQQLAELDDAAGEANAHTVRAACLARLGRIADAETALDQALTAARRARDHRRVNAVLAGAPLAALWGPNPVPRAGGRCLDVVRLLRITTGSPVVEATSTRCQGVLDAMRGRAAAGRQLIDSARRTLTELGMRHALLEVDQFAGLVEMIADDPAAAEPHLRRAYEGFRRMGLDADTAETAAFLARACLLLDRNAEADELCRESERLAGHALRPSITWRTVRAQLFARAGAHGEARRVAQEAVSIAEQTDALVEHGDACLTLAVVLGAAGDIAGARVAAEQAVTLFERKGAAALVERARGVLGSGASTVPSAPETPVVEPENECVRTLRRVEAAVSREAWSEVAQEHAEIGSIESRRKIVGFERVDLPASRMASGAEKFIRDMRAVRTGRPIVAIRGERLALARTVVGTADDTPGAPLDEMLQLVGLDEEGRIALQIWFDVEDMDAAVAELNALHAATAELDALHPRLNAQRVRRLENTASRLYQRLNGYYYSGDWEATAEAMAPDLVHDDRRRAVNGGVRRGRDLEIANARATVGTGADTITSTVVAVRGERLALCRTSIYSRNDQPAAFRIEMLNVVEIDVGEQMTVHVIFDPDDLAAASEELDARYLAGEAVPHAHLWSVVAGVFTALNRHELPVATPDWISIDHRRGTPLAQTDLKGIVTTLNELTPDLSNYVEAVHILSDRGAVITQVSRGTSPEGFDALWRIVNLLTVDGDAVNRCELFDELELDAAIARFDELSRPAHRLDNIANRVLESYLSHYAAREWDAMAPILAEDFSADDRRHVVNSGVRYGRDNEVANLKAFVEIGCSNITTEPVAIRGERLVLARHSFIAPNWPDLDTETVDVVEINADGQIVAEILFEAEDLDAAFAELEARYLSGEAAERAHRWSIISEGYAGLNRRQIPAASPNLVNIDHRRVTPFASGDLIQFIHASWADTPINRIYVRAVHRLTEDGALVTSATSATSHDGFEAEWSEFCILLFEGDMFSHVEVFDDTEFDAAIARFDELSRPAKRSHNTASRVEERAQAYITAGDWDAVAGVLADDVTIDDRRRVVNAGLRRGRDAVIEDLRVGAEIGLTEITPTAIATRGETLTLGHIRYSGGAHRQGAGVIDLVQIVEIDVDERIVALVLFDPDNLEGAVAELDSRYAAGEGADHARTWSVITEGCVTLNRLQFPATTPNFGYSDRRRIANIGTADMREFFRAASELTPDMTTFVETVHRLGDIGAVVSQVARGTSRDGFYAEWRVVNLYQVDGDALSRCEVFDDGDLDAAIERFEELSRHSQPENTATRMYKRFLAHFADRDWNAMDELVALDNRHEDRRRVVNAGIQVGRDAVIASMRAIADVGVTVIDVDFIATRGDRLALGRQRVSGGRRPEAFGIEVLIIAEVDDDNRLDGGVAFDIDDLDAAFAELDARYLAGEAAPHAQTYSLIADAFAAVNRRELPVTTTDFVSIDHRRPIAFAPGEMMAYLQATLNDAPELRIDIETIHRLSSQGAVVSHTWHNTSSQGFDAEWRVIGISMVEHDKINRCELYDESDLDVALTRFDELSRQNSRFVNTASRVAERFRAAFAARDWSAMAEMLAEDIYNEDRRPVVNAGIRYGRDSFLQDMQSAADAGIPALGSTDLATRGERLVLVRAESVYEEQPGAFLVENLAIAEIDADGRGTAQVIFGVDDLNAAFEELDKRYVAGEAAAYAGTWSVIAEAYAALNRHEIPPTTPNWVNIDHRRGGTTFETGDLATYIQASWEDSPQNKIRVETVHRLSHLGAVVTSATRGVSTGGFYAEWRQVDLVTVDGNKLNRTELFDEDDLEVALAKFDELNGPAQLLDNTARRVLKRSRTCFAARDWDGMRANLAEDFTLDDRRRTVNGGTSRGRDSLIRDVRTAADVGFTGITEVVVALRGERLILTQARYTGDSEQPDAFFGEVLHVIEINPADEITTTTVFDPDDFDSAFAELDARYLAGEAAAHARTWSVLAPIPAAFNRRELPVTTTDCINIDHRRGAAFSPGELTAYVRATWEMSPEAYVNIESVHRLSDFGAVVTHGAHAVSKDGFAAEWRVVNLYGVTGDRISRGEIFDEEDLDAALAKFDEISAPALRPDNAAMRAWRRFSEVYNRRDLEGFLAVHDEDAYYDDRRKGLRDEGSVDPDVGRALLFEAAPSWRLAIEPIATRGEALALMRGRFRDIDEPDGPSVVEVLAVVEVSDRELIAYEAFFDPDEIDSALAELDARFLAGVDADHSHIWKLVNQTYARFNRHELSQTTADWVNVDHRRAMVPAPGEMNEYVSAMWAVAPDVRTRIESVHRLSELGAVFTHAEVGTSQEGFDAEWREITLLMFDGELISRCELFDDEDLVSALSRFDELSVPTRRLDNAAIRGDGRAADAFNRGDLEGYLGVLATNAQYDDRRRGLRNAGPIDREFVRGLLFTGPSSWRVEIEPVAIRGRHLALVRHICRDSGEAGKPVVAEVLAVVEAEDDERISRSVLFDLDEIAAAFQELDSQYLAGEAAQHRDTWSAVARMYTGLNRQELPAWIADVVHLDHRTVVTIDPNDLAETLRAAWDLVPDLTMYVESIHRLTDVGAVVTNRSYGRSKEGFDAEWRMIQVLTVTRGRIDHFELFDEGDVDAAMARLDELSRSAAQLENAATRGSAALADAFNRRDQDGFVAIYGKNAEYDDRRQGLRNVGLLNRDFGNGLFEFEAASSWRVESEPIAIRGNDLALIRHTYRDTADGDQPITVEALLITETDDNELICHSILFDPDDVEAAHEELDARFAAGGGADHARTWSVIARAYRALSRRELPATTRNWVNIDHRRGASVAPCQVTELLRAAMELTAESILFVEQVHRLSDMGAVVTQVVTGTSRDGFEAEWRDISVIGVAGDLVARLEVFDESDLDAAIARFDHLSLPAIQLENTASRARAHVCDTYNRRDMDGFLSLASGRYVDRRKGLQYEGAADRVYAAAVLSGTPTSWHLECEPLAIRGDRLALSYETFRDTADAELPVTVELIALTDLTDEFAPCVVFFDPNDIDAAFAELTARWIASGEVAHPEVIEAQLKILERANRHDWDAVAADHARAVFVNHRQLPAGGDTIADHMSSMQAMASLIPDFWVEPAQILNHSAIGAVTSAVLKGRSTEGSKIEIPIILLSLLRGERLSRLEVFDLNQRDLALVRFEELNVTAPLLDNAVTRILTRVVDSLNRRDIDSYLAIFTDDARYEDRRKGLRDEGQVKPQFARAVIEDAGAGWLVEIKCIAVRGPHLTLCHLTYRDHDEADHPVVVEALFIAEITVSQLISTLLLFDPDDIDAAFAELTARWIASGQCGHPGVMEAIQTLAESANRQEWDELTARHAGATYANHRQLRGGADTVADDKSSLRMLTSLVPGLRFELTDVLRLSASGIVIHTVAKGTSTDDVPFELPLVVLLLIDGDRIAHAETYDLNQREQALTRFDELTVDAPQPNNALARVLARVVDAFEKRDPDRYLALFAKDCTYEDRRKGLRDAGSIRPDYAQTVTFGAAAGWQAEFETIAVRGERLMLGRATFRDQSEAGSPIAVEALNIGSINDDELISWFAVLDPDDIDAALAELTARWIASGEVAYPDVIEAALRSNEMYNRHDWDAIAANEFGATYINHRQLVSAEPETIEDHWRSIRALASLIPDLRTEPVEILAHSAKGVVTDLVVKGRTPEGAVIEFPAITLILFGGTRVIHMEAFDIDQRDQALARFHELND